MSDAASGVVEWIKETPALTVAAVVGPWCAGVTILTILAGYGAYGTVRVMALTLRRSRPSRPEDPETHPTDGGETPVPAGGDEVHGRDDGTTVALRRPRRLPLRPTRRTSGRPGVPSSNHAQGPGHARGPGPEDRKARRHAYTTAVREAEARGEHPQARLLRAQLAAREARWELEDASRNRGGRHV